MLQDLSYKINSLPQKSGVYIMKDKDKNIIYVGKAKVLKNRVKQYFKSNNHSPKVKAMVDNIYDFEYIICDSELEALILECNLIKLHMPKYNILLKDDKTYPFIKITVNEMYPQISITRNIKKDGAKYFGPYLSAIVIRELIEVIRDIFKLRSCSQKFPQDYGKKRPCLYYHIGKCSGVCTGNVDENEYRKLIDEVCSFLNGNTDKLIENLEEKMYEYSNNLDFEKAAFYRDKIETVKNISQKQKATSVGGTNADAIAMYSQNSTDCIQVFFIRNGKMLGRENYFIENSENNDKKEVLTDFIKQYYTDASFVPSEILVEFDIDEIDLISEWLSLKKGKKVEVKSPKRGENLKLINMIKLNAKKELQNKELKILKDIKFKNTALVGLKNTLNLEDVPHKIEAFDISGFAGDDLVASMVSFVDAKPNKKGYKLYKIKTVDKNDDYSSMREVITRRFLRLKNDNQSLNDIPDVIFVDGGIGHVNCAKSVLKELDFDIPVFGIQKDDNHNTRAVASENGIIEFDKTSESFMLLVNIQDEMHRRAISYYRNVSEKRNKKSKLDNIKGVGEKKRNLILKHLKNVKNATLEEIENVPGIDKKTARNIYEYFRQN